MLCAQSLAPGLIFILLAAQEMIDRRSGQWKGLRKGRGEEVKREGSKSEEQRRLVKPW